MKTKIGLFALILLSAWVIYAQNDNEEKKGIEAQKISIKAADGFEIKAMYYPVTPGKKSACIILLHMLCGRKENWDVLAPALAKEGYFVLAIDLRGHGDSTAAGKTDIAKLDFSKPAEQEKAKAICAKMALDAAAAEKFLKGIKEIDSKRIAIIGASIGANVALNYAASSHSVKNLVLLSPGLDYMGIKTKDALEKCIRLPVFSLACLADSGSVSCIKEFNQVARDAVKAGKITEKDSRIESKIFEKSLTPAPDGTITSPDGQKCVFGHGTDIFKVYPEEATQLVLDWLRKTFPAAEVVEKDKGKK